MPMSTFALVKILPLSQCVGLPAIICVFGPEYLRAPNEDDTKKLMASNERIGWPGMLGSIDCMHWT